MTAAVRPSRRRSPPAPLLFAFGLAVAGLLAACDEDPEVAADTRGLLILSGEVGRVELTVRDEADPTGREIDLPDPATSWVTAGRANVLVATLTDGRTFVSDRLTGDEDPDWREVVALGVDEEPVDGPLYFGTWDPPGGAFALIGSDFGDGSGLRVVVVDPALEGGSEATFAGTTAAAAPPAWVDDDRVAVAVTTDDGPGTLIVDTASASSIPGPAGVVSIATSSDATMTAIWRGDGPVEVLATEAWLAGDSATIRLEPPAGATRPAALALDGTGSRLAIVWLEADGAPLAVAVHERTRDWAETTSIDLGSDAAATVAWLR